MCVCVCVCVYVYICVYSYPEDFLGMDLKKNDGNAWLTEWYKFLNTGFPNIPESKPKFHISHLAWSLFKVFSFFIFYELYFKIRFFLNFF